MSYKPSDKWVVQFTTHSFTTGQRANADYTPTATAVYSGSDTADWPLTVTNVQTGVYAIGGTIPATYAAGATACVRVFCGVGSLAANAIVGTFVLDSKRVGDLNDIAAGAAMTLTAAGYTATSSEVWTAAQRLLTGAVTVTGIVSLAVNPAIAGDQMLLTAAGYTAATSSVWTGVQRLLTAAVTVTGVVSLQVNPAVAGDAMILTAGGYTAASSEIWTATQRLLTGAVTVTGVVSLQVNPAIAGDAMLLTAAGYTAASSSIWTASVRGLTEVVSLVAGTNPTATEISSMVWSEAQRLLTGASTITGVVSIVANAPVNIVQVAGVAVSGVADFKATGFATPANVTAATSIIGGADGDTLKTLGDAIAAIGSQAGAGGSSVPIYVTDASSTPIADADVWLTNINSVVTHGTLQTDSNGKATFMLDVGSTYWRWVQKDGYSFSNPQTLTVTSSMVA